MTTITPPNSGFHTANQIPPSTKPTTRFKMLDHKTFSRLTQFRTGHAHIGEYYHHFGIYSESRECPCRAADQTRTHILHRCSQFKKFRHILGQGRQASLTTLMGRPKGILRLAQFIKKSQAIDKRTRHHDVPPEGEPTRPRAHERSRVT
jgi:hypothetical protein